MLQSGSEGPGRSQRFKACRTCRRQKMRCEGSPGRSCPRCTKAGVECIFDVVDSKKRRRQNTSEVAQQSTVESLRDEIRTLKNQVHSASEGRRTVSLHPESHPRSINQQLTSSPTRRNNDAIDVDEDASSEHQDQRTNRRASIYFDAPILAIHAGTLPAASTNSTPNHPTRAHDQRVASSMTPLRAPVDAPDIVADIFPDEGKARSLVAVFFAGSNPCVPIFDPIFDTFDSLRQRSPFCLVTMLYAALGPLNDSPDYMVPKEELRRRCKQEAHRLAAESLFENPMNLETVQAMILLALYSEKTRFAIGHALQMAIDLRLDTAVDQILDEEPHGIKPHSPEQTARWYELLRRARTWIFLHHAEREMAFGTARTPRIREVSMDLLKKHLAISGLFGSDIRFVAIIEMVYIRGQLQSAISHASTVAEMQIQETEKKSDEWYQYWDDLLERCGIDISSFHRISLWIQKNFAVIHVYCAMLGKCAKIAEPPPRHVVDELIRRITKIALDLVDYIEKNKCYQWHLQLAPTYNALMVAFLGILLLEMWKKWPHIAPRRLLKSRVNSIIKLLSPCPFQQPKCRVQELLNETIPDDGTIPSEGGNHSPATNGLNTRAENSAENGMFDTDREFVESDFNSLDALFGQGFFETYLGNEIPTSDI